MNENFATAVEIIMDGCPLDILYDYLIDHAILFDGYSICREQDVVKGFETLRTWQRTGSLSVLFYEDGSVRLGHPNGGWIAIFEYPKTEELALRMFM